MNCPRCGANNRCGVTVKEPQSLPKADCAGDLSCWCFQLQLTAEQRAQLPESASCYCLTCLEWLTREVHP